MKANMKDKIGSYKEIQQTEIIKTNLSKSMKLIIL